jgi:hypothetical protein
MYRFIHNLIVCIFVLLFHNTISSSVRYVYLAVSPKLLPSPLDKHFYVCFAASSAYEVVCNSFYFDSGKVARLLDFDTLPDDRIRDL